MTRKSILSLHDRITYGDDPGHSERCAACNNHDHLDPYERGFVYFLQAEGSGLIKIGYSRDPEFRLRNIRVMSTEPLRLIATHPGGRRLESALHRAFRPERVRGEWFRPVPDLVKIIQRSHRQFIEPRPVEMVHESVIIEQFSIPRAILIRWAKDGVIGHSRLGRGYWFSADEIARLIESHEVPRKDNVKDNVTDP